MKKCLIQNEHEEQAKRVERCCLCNEKIGISYEERLREKVDAVPLSQKQGFVNFLKKMNVGDAMRKIDPLGKHENIVWYQIVDDQIKSVLYFDRKVV